MGRVLFLANHFHTLHAFRKEMIQAMLEEGHDVYLSLPESSDNAFFEQKGCKVISTPIDRRGINPIKDLTLIWSYYKTIKQVSPDIIFSFTVKPNIYGSYVSNRLHYKQVCNVTGTGATFLKDNWLSKLCRFLYKKTLAKCYKVFFQNTGDRDYFINYKMVGNNYELLPGSGCNLVEHSYKEMPFFDEIKFIFIGRVMRLKGVDEYLDCAFAVKKNYPNTKFYIAGWNEENEYKAKVDKAERDGVVEYVGFVKNINEWIEKCHCVILPSYGGEGVPNVLLEASATGRVCIGSNIPGTRDVVDDGVTGFLFEPRNSGALIDVTMRFLSMSSDDMTTMGKKGREKIENEFNRVIVVNKYLNEINMVCSR